MGHEGRAITLEKVPVTVGSSIAVADGRARLSAAAAEFMAAGALERSPVLNRLFRFLLERSMDGDIPKEAEIAHIMFGRERELDAINDATVRSTVHRLRRKLAEFNAGLAPGLDRLELPLGGYELRVTDEIREDAYLPGDTTPSATTVSRWKLWLPVSAVALAIVSAAVGAVAWSVFAPAGNALARNPLAASNIWRPFLTQSNPIAIVIGDAPGQADPPGASPQVPFDVMVAANELINALGVRPTQRYFALTSTSKIDFYGMSGSNLIYVGLLDSMGRFYEPVFASSRYSLSADRRTFTDKFNGKTFVAGKIAGAPDAQESVEYAYLNRLGNENSSFLMVSGTSDAAVMMLASVLANPSRLEALEPYAADGNDFEALYTLRFANGDNLDARLEQVTALPATDEAGNTPPSGSSGE